MFHSFGWPEAMIILTVVLIVFGVGKLPQVGGALGKGMREFRRGKEGVMDEIEGSGEQEHLDAPASEKGSANRLPAGKAKI